MRGVDNLRNKYGPFSLILAVLGILLFYLSSFGKTGIILVMGIGGFDA